MSLRKPQKESLELLENIFKEIELKGEYSEIDIDKIKSICPTFTDFEREFISLTFALATGVGKTRLMGTFITYLYTNYGIKNFLVIAPNTTIYDKLKKDFADSSNPKYVFNGVGCFSKPPQVIADDDYNQKNISLFDSDIKIYIFNISKLDRENVKIKAFNEMLGSSFFEKLAGIKDLVMIMDESHHYRADAGFKTLNELKPILGLELTATPFVNTNKGQVPFKNVVYEYPLAKAIADGYTRTPYAVTRSNVDFYNFGDDQIDKLMLEDGVICHENIKKKLFEYSVNNKKRIVKPFMMVVCKDVEHAEKIYKYIISDDFHSGYYKYRTIIVHSSNKGSEQEAYMRSLLEIERIENKTEIVIHVNMLKEGWDVNNLYTIVPLRTATSKILREQMVGRGLRLPYGERTGVEEIDSVYLTAHDKFKEILEEAQKGDSIFKKEYFIKAEDIPQDNIKFTQIAIDINNTDEEIAKILDENNIEKNENTIEIMKKAQMQVIRAVERVTSVVEDDGNIREITSEERQRIIDSIRNKFTEDEQDLAKTYMENEMPITAWMNKKIDKVYKEVVQKYIPIPQIRVTEEGITNCYFEDFNLNCSILNYAPIENELLIQNLTDTSQRIVIDGTHINYEAYNPSKMIMELLRDKAEIDYSKMSKLLQKLILQFCTYFTEKYSDSGMKNIVMMNRRGIAEDIYKQMMQHYKVEEGFIKEEVLSTRKSNNKSAYTYKTQKGIFETYSSDDDGNIKSVLFTGIKRGVFGEAKFDSMAELILARILESESDFVCNWLRPASTEFNISYNCNGIHSYEPDFVVETPETIFLVEVKRSDWTDNSDVIAKKERAVSYCKIATEWNLANGYKPWKHVFIPDDAIKITSTFEQLARTFSVSE
ncbi:MAG: DEAD/DEAH box helicase family protein [Clostridia bacterium]|nr:DEAD/DEAH box helicase family protein [Clostridia bacterium]